MPDTLLESSKWFRSMDGKVFGGLSELAKEFRRITENGETAAFQYHFKRKDYSNWIRDVFENPKLAEKLSQAKDVSEALEILEEYISNHKYNAPTKEEEDRLKQDIQRFSENSEEKLESVKNMKIRLNKKLEDSDKVDALEEFYSQLYVGIADARKEGKDVFIPSLKLKNIKSKIEYFKISQNLDDYAKVMSLLKEIDKELEDCRSYSPPDIKKEIMEAVQSDSS